jgi:hypothetical protein
VANKKPGFLGEAGLRRLREEIVSNDLAAMFIVCEGGAAREGGTGGSRFDCIGKQQ